MGRTIIFLAALAIIVQTQGQVTDIVRGEYWIQQDDGVDGINIPFAIGGANDVVDFQLPIDLTGYAPGTYDVGIRVLDGTGHWSLTSHAAVLVIAPEVAGVIDQANISVYPNPFAEQITVQPTDDQPVRVILYDPQGKLVVDRIIRSETVLNLTGRASGMYTAFFWKDLKVIHRVTLVKQ
jgi:hypothetical protein